MHAKVLKQSLKYIVFTLLVTVFLAGCGVTITDPHALTDTENISGNESAKLVLVEYGDFQCPACANFQPVLETAKQRFGDDLKIVFRHLPLVGLHPNAIPAAHASEAAAAQGEFWGMHDKLYGNQGEWSSDVSPTETFKKYATELELDVDKFTADYKSKVGQDKLSYDMAVTRKLGLNSTPTFFVNGEQVPSVRSADEFIAILDSFLNAAEETPEITEPTTEEETSTDNES